MPEIRFMPIVFNVPSQDLGFTEMIAERAVARTLADVRHGRADVKARFDHLTWKTLARTNNGTLTLTVVPGKGVRAAVDINMNTSYGRDALAAFTRGDVTGGSFVFRTITDEWWMENGTPMRRVDDMHFKEVSLVSEPAYLQTESAGFTTAHGSAARHDRAVVADVARRVRKFAAEYPDRDLRFTCTYREDGEPKLELRSYARRGAYSPSLAMRRRQALVASR
jgi:HK97 family phage prohead protease